MNHYTYLLQAQTSDMMYIGVRSSECLPEEDNTYWGSSKYLPEDVSETFDKFILGRFNTRKEAAADEIHRHNMNDVAVNPLFVNKVKQTSTGYDRSGCTHSEETKQKLRDARKLQAPLTEEARQKMSEIRSGKGNGMYGKKHSEETKLKMSIPKTTEQKQKLSEAHKGKIHSDEHKQKISNGGKARWKLMSDSTCPHCGLTGRANMKRYHFNNCKHKGEILSSQ